MVAIAVLTVFVYLLFVVWLMPFWNASLCARVALAGQMARHALWTAATQARRVHARARAVAAALPPARPGSGDLPMMTRQSLLVLQRAV